MRCQMSKDAGPNVETWIRLIPLGPEVIVLSIGGFDKAAPSRKAPPRRRMADGWLKPLLQQGK